uniref:ABC transporter permease n=1 Tax=Thermus islandicus TaxID=540988 RepID=A0A7C2BZ94_9DEIN
MTAQTPSRPGSAAAEAVLPARGPTSLWADAWRRLLRNRAAVAGMVFIGFMLLVAVFADLIAPYPYWQQDITNQFQPPSWGHPFGTDHLGRDVLSRLIYGARVSMAVGFIVQAIIVLIGVPVGAIAGYFGGKIDQFLMRFVDVMYSFPDLLLIIIVMTTLRAATGRENVSGLLWLLARADDLFGGLLGVFIALGLTSWLTVARLVRGQILSLKEREFVEAARAIGAGHFRIIRVHLVPNTLAPIIVAVTFGIPNAILVEAALSFIGLGVKPPMPSWGLMILDGYRAMRAYPHLLLFPAAALSLTVLSYNFFGDGLRDALDPWMKQ